MNTTVSFRRVTQLVVMALTIFAVPDQRIDIDNIDVLWGQVEECSELQGSRAGLSFYVGYPGTYFAGTWKPVNGLWFGALRMVVLRPGSHTVITTIKHEMLHDLLDQNDIQQPKVRWVGEVVDEHHPSFKRCEI
jgi:hypothetical protein